MFQVSFVMIVSLSLGYGILHKSSNSNESSQTNYKRIPTTSSLSSGIRISAISNNNKSQKINFQNKFYKIITLKNDNRNQNMIYATPISVLPPANADAETREWDSRYTQRNFDQEQHDNIRTTHISSSKNYDETTKLLVHTNNRNNGSINNNYGNINGNKYNYLSNTKNTNYYYDKRADNNYVIKNDTNLSFSHNYPIIDYNYKDDADYIVDDYHKTVDGGDILKQQQQHGIYDSIKLGGIYDYHPPPNPLLQVLFSRYGRHLPNSYFPSTRNYGFYAYGAGNDINNNLPNGGYKIEMEFDSNK